MIYVVVYFLISVLVFGWSIHTAVEVDENEVPLYQLKEVA